MRWKFILPFAAIFLLLTLAIAALLLLRLPFLHNSGEGTASVVTQAKVLSQNESGTTSIGIEAPAQVAEGKSFTAMVKVTNITDFDACNYVISYDGLVLEVTNVSSGNIAGTPIPVDIWEEVAPGEIRVVQNVPGISGVSGSGYLAEIQFQTIGASGNTSAINPRDAVLGDKNAQEIPITYLGSSLAISNALDPDFLTDTPEALVGQGIRLTDTTSGGTPPYTYSWDFDDDGVIDSSVANPTASYAVDGTYTVTLSVTDALGDKLAKARTGYITVYPSLEVNFSVSNHKNAEGIMIFTFGDTTSGGKAPRTLAWNLDNNGQMDSTVSGPAYAYAAAGTYPVILKATDALGNSSAMIKIIILHPLDSMGEEGAIGATEITEIERSLFTSDDLPAGVDPSDVELIIVGSR